MSVFGLLASAFRARQRFAGAKVGLYDLDASRLGELSRCHFAPRLVGGAIGIDLLCERGCRHQAKNQRGQHGNCLFMEFSLLQKVRKDGELKMRMSRIAKITPAGYGERPDSPAAGRTLACRHQRGALRTSRSHLSMSRLRSALEPYFTKS